MSAKSGSGQSGPLPVGPWQPQLSRRARSAQRRSRRLLIAGTVGLLAMACLLAYAARSAVIYAHNNATAPAASLGSDAQAQIVKAAPAQPVGRVPALVGTRRNCRVPRAPKPTGRVLVVVWTGKTLPNRDDPRVVDPNPAESFAAKTTYTWTISDQVRPAVAEYSIRVAPNKCVIARMTVVPTDRPHQSIASFTAAPHTLVFAQLRLVRIHQR